MTQSSLERHFDTLRLQLAADLPEPKQQFRFAKPRRWAFDVAWPNHKVAVELEGIYGRGKSRHRTRGGYHNDCTKYNAGVERGWYILRYTYKHLDEDPQVVFDQIRKVLEARQDDR